MYSPVTGNNETLATSQDQKDCSPRVPLAMVTYECWYLYSKREQSETLHASEYPLSVIYERILVAQRQHPVHRISLAAWFDWDGNLL